MRKKIRIETDIIGVIGLFLMGLGTGLSGLSFTLLLI